MVRRTPQGLRLNYNNDLSNKVNPVLTRIQEYYNSAARGDCKEFDSQNSMLVAELNPKRSLFLTGHLPCVADFELAYLVEHFKWICTKQKVKNPFESFPQLSKISENLKELDGVNDYIQQENKEGKRWFDEGKAIHERVKIN